MKVIAMYLPQFHRVPENDEWWGDGFTEWTAVKNAQKYYEGQVQPRVPLNDNYYNLLEKSTMEWQAYLMHQYGVYGMCFYHYYFKDGRKILEKPAENLLSWKDIDMPFCFSWANETWARSWSKLSSKNAWSTVIDSSMKYDEEKSILLEQQYGTEEDWIKHFEYLLEFFKDDRYIKVDNKPMFIIYKPYDISCLSKMILVWRNLAKKSGFDDLYLIGVNCGEMGVFDAILEQEPQRTIIRTDNHIVDSGKLWDKIINKPINKAIKTYFCGFPGYDDTPRRGEGGVALSSTKPIDFEKGMTDLFKKGYTMGNEYTFINAWNEWGEGMYLEPDELNGYGMLEALKNALNKSEKYKTNNEFVFNNTSNESEKINMYYSYRVTFDKWLTCFEREKKISDYLKRKKCTNIAIYGLGILGHHLVEQLENTDVCIKYGIDRRGADEKQRFPVYKLEDNLPEADVIIVTVTYDFAKIYKQLYGKVDCEIISLDEMLDSMINDVV